MSRRRRAQLGNVLGQRFDIQPAPAPVVKRLGDRVVRRVIGAHVDVKTALDMCLSARVSITSSPFCA